MANIVSHKHTILTINGHRIEGTSDDDTPVEMPDIELVTEKFGQDGSLHVTGTGRRGGEVMVRLLPSSRSAVQLMKWHAQIQGGQRINFEGTWEDTLNGNSTVLRGGFLKTAPGGLHPEKNAEFTFVFEEVTPSPDGARFNPAPITN